MSDVTRVEEIYLAAVERTDPADRAAFLDAACGDDADLRRRVDGLIAAHPRVGRFLEPADRTHAYTSGQDAEAAAAGTVVGGRYKLLERIGEGGMGEVWMADQTEPVKRRVAVKLIKAGMGSRNVLSRFAAERQALAVMDHPHIAKVLDAGTTPDGRPYFVMELVKGVPITEFCDARRLTPAERLALFVPVCQAIQHAHQKGVIHRDVKPSNVLVELHDDRPVPKVIDFGVAKAVGHTLTDGTLFTGFGTLVGTPAYMAPEQATFNALDVDTRADVYALGVLLYELLAGSPPVEGERLKKAALEEVLRLVREEEPPRPSQRLSTSQARASIAAVRGAEPEKLSALLRGELDWIVMRALEKDRARRYESATALARDVQRYLSGDAVEACPPTWGYRLRKAYHRNRAAVVTGTAFATLLLTGIAVTTALAIQARRAEAAAEDRRIEAEANAKRADEQASEAAYFNGKADAAALALKAELQRVQFLKADLQTQLNLDDYRGDPKLGLLGLVQTLESLPAGADRNPDADLAARQKALREFITAAVISAGQEFAPLVPPLDTKRVERVSPDGRLCIAGAERDGLQLVAIPGLTRVAVLREGSERLLQWGFSPDGQTAFTQDTDGVARFWGRDGKLRSKTPLRPDRCVYPPGLSMEQLQRSLLPWDDFNQLLVADGVAVVRSKLADWAWKKNDKGEVDKAGDGDNFCMKPTNQRAGPHDLYDTRTGRLIRRLTPPGRTWTKLELSPDTRWIVTTEEACDERGRWKPGQSSAQLVVVSAADGRELARLGLGLSQNSPADDRHFSVSPGGRWVVAYQQHHAKPGGDWVIDPTTVRLWRTTDWQPVSDPTLADALAQVPDAIHLRFVTDDWLAVQSQPSNPDAYYAGWLRPGQPGSWRPSKNGVLASGLPVVETVPPGRTLLRWYDDVSAADTLERLRPPAGRKYHPALAQLAPDGRFWTDARVKYRLANTNSDGFWHWYGQGHSFDGHFWYGQKYNFEGHFLHGDRFGHDLDTATEKDLPTAVDGPYLPGFGRVAVRTHGSGADDDPRPYDGAELRILPDPARLNVPPALVELWAQVVVGGELGPDGRFVAWDEPTWAAKQRELAAATPPYPDFPFPGWAAAEPRLWPRVRASEQREVRERDRLIEEWRRRTGRTRLDPGPDAWRTNEPSPLPRLVK